MPRYIVQRVMVFICKPTVAIIGLLLISFAVLGASAGVSVGLSTSASATVSASAGLNASPTANSSVSVSESKLKALPAIRRSLVWSSGFTNRISPMSAWEEYLYPFRDCIFSPCTGHSDNLIAAIGMNNYQPALPGVFERTLNSWLSEVSTQQNPIELGLAVFSRAGVKISPTGEQRLVLEYDDQSQVEWREFLDIIYERLQNDLELAKRLTINFAVESSFAGLALDELDGHPLKGLVKRYAAFAVTSSEKQVDEGVLTDMWADVVAIEAYFLKHNITLCQSCSPVERRFFILTRFPFWEGHGELQPIAIGSNLPRHLPTVEEQVAVAAAFGTIPYVGPRLILRAANYFRRRFQEQPVDREKFYELLRTKLNSNVAIIFIEKIMQQKWDEAQELLQQQPSEDILVSNVKKMSESNLRCFGLFNSIE